MHQDESEGSTLLDLMVFTSEALTVAMSLDPETLAVNKHLSPQTRRLSTLSAKACTSRFSYVC
jgi:hypothetical protein